MLDIGILCVAIARARVAALNLTESLTVDLVEKRFDAIAPEKLHASNLGGRGIVSLGISVKWVQRHAAVTLQKKRQPFDQLPPFFPLMPLESYSFIAACNSCIALRMSWRAFCRASNFFC